MTGLPSRCRTASRSPGEKRRLPGPPSTTGPAAPAVPATEAARGTACPVPGRSSSFRTPPSPLRSRRPRACASHWKGGTVGACRAEGSLPTGPGRASPAAPPRPTMARSTWPRPAPRRFASHRPQHACTSSQPRSEERARPNTLLKGHAPAPLGEDTPLRCCRPIGGGGGGVRRRAAHPGGCSTRCLLGAWPTRPCPGIPRPAGDSGLFRALIPSGGAGPSRRKSAHRPGATRRSRRPRHRSPGPGPGPTPAPAPAPLI